MPKSAVEFAPWSTSVENDHLTFVGLRFGGEDAITSVQEGITLSHTEPYAAPDCALEASFISLEKRLVAVFKFDEVSAFRVLDEHGLTELWQASSEALRPAGTTFKVRGHQWQNESELAWIMGGAEFSHMIATRWFCLEVVTRVEPRVELIEPNGLYAGHNSLLH